MEVGQDDTLVATAMGRVASMYYLRHQTLEHFARCLSPQMDVRGVRCPVLPRAPFLHSYPPRDLGREFAGVGQSRRGNEGIALPKVQRVWRDFKGSRPRDAELSTSTHVVRLLSNLGVQLSHCCMQP